MLAHLTIAGVVEALTAGVFAYLQRANLPLLRLNHPASPITDAELTPPARSRWRWALRRPRRDGRCSPRSACSPPAGPSVRTRRRTSTSASGLNAVPKGCPLPGSGSHTLSAATASPTTTPTLAYLVSAVVGASRSASRSPSWSSLSALVAPPRAATTRHAAAHAGMSATNVDDPALAARSRGRALPVRVHRQAAQGQFVAKTLTGGGTCCARRMFTEDVAREPGCCSGSSRAQGRWPARPARRDRARPPRRRAASRLYALTLVLAPRRRCRWASSSSGCGCSSRSSPASSCFPATLNVVTDGRGRRALGTGTAPLGFTAQGLTGGGAHRRPGSRRRSRWSCC